MTDIRQPGRPARRAVLRLVIGVVAGGAASRAAVRRAEAAEQAEIAVDNFTFVPAVLRVKAGTTVTWVNHDDMPHSIVLPSLKVRSPTLDSNQSFAWTFAKAGAYGYVCGIHPFMKGKVEVSA